MANWVYHVVEFPATEAEGNQARIACEQLGNLWMPIGDGFKRMDDGTLRVCHETRYTPTWAIAWQVSITLPHTLVKLAFDEPMMVIFGDVEFLAGHVVRFRERRNTRVDEWDEGTRIYRVIELEYANADDPFGDFTETVVSEDLRVECDFFGVVVCPASENNDLGEPESCGDAARGGEADV